MNTKLRTTSIRSTSAVHCTSVICTFGPTLLKRPSWQVTLTQLACQSTHTLQVKTQDGRKKQRAPKPYTADFRPSTSASRNKQPMESETMHTYGDTSEAEGAVTSECAAHITELTTYQYSATNRLRRLTENFADACLCICWVAVSLLWPKP